MHTYLTALMLLATLGLVSCGGGNEGASTGTPVVAQVTIAPTVATCLASKSYGGGGPLLTATTSPSINDCCAALALFQACQLPHPDLAEGYLTKAP